MGQGFVKLNRTKLVDEMIESYPMAFVLLSVIAMRAFRGDGLNPKNLEIGQAVLGDYGAYGMTRKQYRIALDKLQKWGLIERKGANKGTVVKLIDKRIFDINEASEGQQGANRGAIQGANKGPTEGPLSRSKEVKKGKKEKKTNVGDSSATNTPASIAKGFFLAHRKPELRGERYREYAARLGSEVDNFVSYWTERTKDGKQERWQTEDTWELPKRIGRWRKNNPQFGSNGKADAPVSKKHRMIGQPDDFGNKVADVEYIVDGRAWRYRTEDGKRFEWDEGEGRYKERGK